MMSSLESPPKNQGSDSTKFGIIALPHGNQVEASLYTWTFVDFSKFLCLTPDGEAIQAHAEAHDVGEEQYRSLFAAESIKTPKFVRGELVARPSKWSMDLGIDDDNEGFLSLNLQLNQNYTSNAISAKFRLAIVNAAGKILLSNVYDDVREWSDDNARGPHRFISLTRLWNERKTFLEGNSLRLSLELFVFGGCTLQDGQVSSFRSRPELAPPIAELLRLLYPTPTKKTMPSLYVDLWRTKKCADLTLVCADGKTFLVHKVIICCASPFFSGMFRSGMLECSSKTVQLPEMKSDVLAIILEFIYTGEVVNFDWDRFGSNPSEDPFLGELLGSVDKLMLEGMKDVIFQYFWTTISFDNVHNLLNLAFTFNANQAFLHNIGVYLAQNMKHLGSEDSEEFQHLMLKHPLALVKMISQHIQS